MLKQKTNFLTKVVLSFMFTFVVGELAQAEDQLTFSNPEDAGPFVLSDLIIFQLPELRGRSITILEKDDPSDDVTIQPGEEFQPELNLPEGFQVSSFTSSYLNSAGQEIEVDTPFFGDPLVINSGEVQFPFFETNTDVLYAVNFDVALDNELPAIEESFGLDDFGKIDVDGDIFDWITFYDVSATDGFIDRDEQGNPISPFLSAGTQVTATFNYSVQIEQVPESNSIISVLTALGFGTLFLSKQISRLR